MDSETTDRRLPMAEARALLPDLEASGQTVAAFARERSVPPGPLYLARREARRKLAAARRSSFAEVAVVPSPTAVRSAADPFELKLPSGLTLCVPSGFDEVTLLRLLGTLSAC